MSTESALNSVVSDASEDFEGPYEEVIDYAQISILAKSDGDVVLGVTWSTDGVNDDLLEEPRTVMAAENYARFALLAVKAKFFKVWASAGGGATYLRLQTLKHTVPITPAQAYGAKQMGTMPVGGLYDPSQAEGLSAPEESIAPFQMTQYRGLHTHMVNALGFPLGIRTVQASTATTIGASASLDVNIQDFLPGGIRSSEFGVAQITVWANKNLGITVKQRAQGSNDDIQDSWNYTANSTGDDVSRTIAIHGISGTLRITNQEASTATVRYAIHYLPYTQVLPRALSGLGNLRTAVSEALPAGTNNIGDVDVASLPALPAGSNNIGDVDVASLPALPTGDNAIGRVKITNGTDVAEVVDISGTKCLAVAQGPLPAGTNNIGSVKLTDGTDVADVVDIGGTKCLAVAQGPLPAGTNNIGDVDVASLPALPAGTNNIGDVDVASLPALPAGNNNIGDVDVASLPSIPAGTNNIGDVDVLTLPTLPTGDNVIGRTKISDGTNLLTLVDVDGIKCVPVYRQRRASFYALFDRIAPATNKYMATLFNPNANNIFRVFRVMAYNGQVAAVTGVLLEQYLAFITARTAGTSITPRPYDSTDVLGSLTADHNTSAVTERDIMKRFFMLSEEMVLAASGLNVGMAQDRGYQTIFEANDWVKPITLNSGQGVAVRNVTNSTVGTCSYLFEFTQE